MGIIFKISEDAAEKATRTVVDFNLDLPILSVKRLGSMDTAQILFDKYKLPTFHDSLFELSQCQSPPGASSSAAPTPPPQTGSTTPPAWSVKNKLVELCSTVASLTSDTFVLLTEEWRDPGVHDAELIDLSSDSVYRKGRGSRVGRVLVAGPSSILCIRRPDLEFPYLKAIFLEIFLPRELTLLGCVYCLPKQQGSANALLDTLSRAKVEPFRDTLFLRDFNSHVDEISLKSNLYYDPKKDIVHGVAHSGSERTPDVMKAQELKQKRRNLVNKGPSATHKCKVDDTLYKFSERERNSGQAARRVIFMNGFLTSAQLSLRTPTR
ncbi:hypothetical protein ISCGN_020637 [Ixodes scapularis]